LAGGDRLAEASLTVALAYLAFIAGERLFHVSGVVTVLVAGLTVGAVGRARITPYKLGVPRRSVGADRVLGALAGVRAGLDPGAAAAA